MNLASVIAHHAAVRPDHPALIEGERTFSYAALDREVDATAQRLVAAGVGAGDRVGICLKERSEFLIALFAVARIWAVIVPVDWRAPEPERRRIVDTLGLKSLICEPGNTGSLGCAIDWPSLRALAPRTPVQNGGPANGGDAPFLIALSSGSTGRPKGLVVSHQGQLMRNVRLHIDLRHGPHTRYMQCTPLVHASGRNKCISCLINGNTVIIQPPLFRADELVEAAARYRATDLYVVPTTLRSLLQLDYRGAPLFSTLDHLVVGSAPVSVEERAAALRQLTPNISLSYGASGYSTIALLHLGDERMPQGSVGRPTFLTEVEIADDDHRPLARDAEGRVRIRGPGIASEIIGGGTGAEETEYLRDGWYYTGDVGRVPNDGYIYLTGRVANRIRRGGASIAAEEVERVLCEHPAVAEAAVLGRPSRELGQEVIAFVIPRAAIDQRELERHCRQHLTRAKVPSEFHIVTSFPRSAVGKIMRRALLETVVPREALAGNTLDEYR